MKLEDIFLGCNWLFGILGIVFIELSYTIIAFLALTIQFGFVYLQIRTG